jgi:hypothetical protein
MCPTSINVLSDSNNTVMLLHPYRVVAKVATGHYRRLQLELDVARHLHAQHAPVVAPAKRPPPHVHEADGWSIPGFMHTWFCVTQLRQVALL